MRKSYLRMIGFIYFYTGKAKKNKSYVSKLPRPFVFRCAFDSAKFKVWIFFACLIFFFSFLWLACQKIQENLWQTQWNTMNNKLLQLLCSALYLVHPKSSSIFQSCDRLKSDTLAAQGKKKKTLKKPHLGQVFQSVTSFETTFFFLA